MRQCTIERKRDQSVEQEDRDRRIGRRTFLGYLIAGTGAFIGAVVGASGTIFAASPLLSGKQKSRVNLGPANGFQVGVPKPVEFSVEQKDGWVVENNARKSVWVVKKSAADFEVFVARCTHLGCAYAWNASAQQFQCPCHGGRYSIDGQVLGGPPPRNLDTLNYWVQGGNLLIDYEEFRLGIPQKVEA